MADAKRDGEVRRTSPLRPLLALLVLAPFVGEVLSSNVPGSLFLLRPAMAVFAVVTYSIPVLLVRELWVARHLSPAALLVCGLAYGIFNEGLLARTLLMRDHLPVPTFDGYLLAGGLNLSWGITILVWHALFSVATPILIVQSLWREESRSRWLTKKWLMAALAITFVTTLLYFRSEGGPPPPPIYFLAFVIAIGALLAMATRLKGGTPERAPASPASWIPLAAGLSFFAFFAGAFILSGRALPAVAFVSYALAMIVAYAAQLPRIARSRNGVLLFCIGNCAAYSLFVFVAKLHASVDGILVTGVVAGGCVSLVRDARAR